MLSDSPVVPKSLEEQLAHSRYPNTSLLSKQMDRIAGHRSISKLLLAKEKNRYADRKKKLNFFLCLRQDGLGTAGHRESWQA